MIETSMDTSKPCPEAAIAAGYSPLLARNVSVDTLTSVEGMMREIHAAGSNKPGTNLAFAAAYANAWLDGQRNRVQLKYVRVNLSGWRGDRARYIRAFLGNVLDQTKLAGEK